MKRNRLLYALVPVASFVITLVLTYLLTFFDDQEKLQAASFILLLIILMVSLSVIIWLASRIDKTLKDSTLKSVKVYTSSINFNENITDDIKTLENHYLRAAQLINSAEKSIVIFNYIDSHPTVRSILSQIKKRNDGQAGFNNCCAAIEAYYKAIEAKVGFGDINYTRVTMLPLSYPPTSNVDTDFEQIENTKLFKTLNKFTVNHLKKMTEIHKKKPSKVHLKIQPFSVANYSFAIIDDRNMIIELDRYNLAGYSFPHHILNFEDEPDGNVVTKFKEVSETYLDKTFELDIKRDLPRTIGNIKNRETELRKLRMEECIDKYK